ncbi:hypothetical protein GVN21_16810 [Caulobacter sp. SLTY]|uniref:hypothetical protein n=1 Tax=Caulobacter sp. SLTY TaxID=2683262 RepID=UPI0014122003|nr:hypothetical protein [Caulobacter sp. SLTY]NBB17029.1 hypothetical protein [Caulobacter sp. SLTY]
MTLKGWIILAVASAFTGIMAVAAYQGGQAAKYRKLDTAHRACVASITPGARADLQPRLLCDDVTADHWAASVKAAACDRALNAVPQDLHGARAACSAPVMRLHAERTAADTNLKNKTDELVREKASRQAAIARAAADAQVKAERTARREAVDARTPRGADGRAVCDAQCLRDRR